MEAQIDDGRLGMWFDPATGRRRTVWAFAFFGGIPAGLIPDNLRTGFDKPDLYDP